MLVKSEQYFLIVYNNIMDNTNKKQAYEPMTLTEVEVDLQGVLCQSSLGLFSIGGGQIKNAGGMF